MRFDLTCRATLSWPLAVLLVLLLGFAAPLQAQTQAGAAAAPRSVTDWLMRMHEASRERAYSGTLVVSVGTAMSTSRIWHVSDGVQQVERVDTLTGAPRTTIRRNSEVITFSPETKIAWVERRESLGQFPDFLRLPGNAVSDFYAVREDGVERVAGHLADVVEIRPRDALRFGYRIWSERRTGLVVKLQTLGEQGAVLEQMAFSELQLDAPVRMDQLIRMMGDTKGYDVRRPTLKKTTPEKEGWRLREAVPGFQPIGCYVGDAAPSLPGASAAMQWVFSDGLASVSLFVEPFDAQRHSREHSVVIGATNSLTRRVGQHWLTAVGEVPVSTLRRFAQVLERTR